jgi:hypothetical protein
MPAALPLLLALATAPSISAGYLGDFATHPGVFVAAEVPVVGEYEAHEVFAGARAASYLHPGNHVGLMLRGELGYRATASFGLYGEALVGVGAHHRVLDGPVIVDDEGDLVTQGDLGRLTVQPGLALGAGWRTPHAGPLPDRWFLRLDVLSRAPVNAAFRTSLALSAGVSWRFE